MVEPQLDNIDEAWLQLPAAGGGVVGSAGHVLLFTREFLRGYDEGTLEDSRASRELLQNWFAPLAELGDAHRERLLLALRSLLGDSPADLAFGGALARQEMVKLGRWLADQARFEDLRWLIERFIDDPDPPLPGSYTGDPNLDYHSKIESGEIDSSITTVLGQVAWLVKELALRQDQIVAALECIERLLRNENLYVKLQAVVPLTTSACRIRWLWESDAENGTDYCKRFHRLCFELLRQYARYPALADALVRLFWRYRRISTDEAMEVVTSISEDPEAGRLVLFYGAYRESYFKDAEGRDFWGFTPERPRQYLLDVLYGRTGSARLRKGIAHHLSAILSEHPEEIERLAPFVNALLKQLYDPDIAPWLADIARAGLERCPALCVPWLLQLLERAAEAPKDPRVWLSIGPAVTSMARLRPECLPDALEAVASVWQKGGTVQEPVEIVLS